MGELRSFGSELPSRDDATVLGPSEPTCVHHNDKRKQVPYLVAISAIGILSICTW